MEDFTPSNASAATVDDILYVDHPAPRQTAAAEPAIPDYLQDTYYWAYISPRNVPLLDREIVVRTILWQQHIRLQRLAFSEIEPGQRVMQPASVYVSFGPNLSKHVGPEGQVEVGGKVVFVDYATPKWWHPLKLITSIVFDTLEPFAKGLWRRQVREFAADAERFGWRRETIFGDLFQKVVATRER